MVFSSFFPGALTSTWTGGTVVLDQSITVLRIGAQVKTPTGTGCPAAVFRLTDGTQGQDVVLTPGAYWADSGPTSILFAAGATVQALLRTPAGCAPNPGSDANLMVEYKMQETGDAAQCSGTSCSSYCVDATQDTANCGACGAACTNGLACIGGQCGGSCSSNCGTGYSCTSGSSCGSGLCTSGFCAAPLPNGSACTSNPNCQSNSCSGGVCASLSPNGAACSTGSACTSGNCVSGACCNAASCNGPCQTCASGTCGPVAAGTSCGTNKACDGQGNCACASGLKQCGSACVNTQTDMQNCGACGQACPTANPYEVCASGTCTVACTGGLTDCSQQCVNESNDPNNCGGCGIKCQSGQSCNAGSCQAVLSQNGATCSSGTSCASGNCSSGVCCNAACSGNSCQSCLGSLTGGQNGTCANVIAGNACIGANGVCLSGGVCGCTQDTNCASNACNVLTNQCVSSQCIDNHKDGNETDVDCGGANSCSRCAAGKACLVGSDCTSGVCSSGICQP